jgi:hypothetical protein
MEDEFAGAGLEATTHKAWRNSKNILELARRIQRQTRITMTLAVFAVALLMLAIYMLWRVLERCWPSASHVLHRCAQAAHVNRGGSMKTHVK